MFGQSRYGDFNNILRSDINIDIILKDKLLKVKERFDEDISIILLDYFILYRIISNRFENAILMKEKPDDFKNDLEKVFKKDEKIISKLCNIYSGKYSYVIDIFYKLRHVLFDHLKKQLNKEVEKKYLNGDRNIYITKGKQDILSCYLSIITILYGLSFCSKNKIVFYFQPYYRNIKNLYSSLLSIIKNDLINNDVEFVISYRFLHDEYTNTKLLKCHMNNDIQFISELNDLNVNKNLSVSFLDRLMRTDTELLTKEIDLNIDNSKDEYTPNIHFSGNNKYEEANHYER